MRRKRKNENGEEVEPKPIKYRKKITIPEKKRPRYIYEPRGPKGEPGKVWEQKRRDRLKKSFEDLCAMLPNSNPKMSKLDILMGSIKQIGELAEKIKKIEDAIEPAIAAEVARAEAGIQTDAPEEKPQKVFAEVGVNTEPRAPVLEAETQCDIPQKEVEAKETQTEVFPKPVDPQTVPLVTSSSSVRVTPALIPTPIMTSALYQNQAKKNVSPEVSEKGKKKVKRKLEIPETENKENSKVEDLGLQLHFGEERPCPSFDPLPLDPQKDVRANRYSIESLQVQPLDRFKCRKSLIAELPLPPLQDTEIESEIMEALTVPQIHSNPSHAVSPTAAYLVSFPIVPSSGKQIEDEDKNPEKQEVDSSNRTMLDLENLFPSSLFPSIEPALSPIVTSSKKKPPFESPLKETASSNKPSLNFQKFHPQYQKAPETSNFDPSLAKKSPLKYGSGYYQDVTTPMYSQNYNSGLLTSTFSDSRYTEQPSNFTFCLTTVSKSDPKYSTAKGGDVNPYCDKKNPQYFSGSNSKFPPNQTKTRYPFYVEQNLVPPLEEPKSQTAKISTMSCAKNAAFPKPQKPPRSCQQQFSSKYDINWMTSNDSFKSTTPDFSLPLGGFEYFSQPPYSTSSSAVPKSDLYFAHPTEDNTWSPSKMAPSGGESYNQYFTQPLPNLHGDLALNPPPPPALPQNVEKKELKKPPQETQNFLSVQQLMNPNQPQKPPIRTKAEKKSMPTYPCDVNFESRSYNYSAEALINSRSKPSKTAFEGNYASLDPTSSYTEDSFYATGVSQAPKCDPKTFNSASSFIDSNLYQPPCFSRSQSNFSWNPQDTTSKYSTSTQYHTKPYKPPQVASKSHQSNTNKVVNKSHKYQPYNQDLFPIITQEVASYPAYNSNTYSSKSVPSAGGYNFNSGFNGANVSNINSHQNSGSLTNFNVSAICPEINEKVRQQNW